MKKIFILTLFLATLLTGCKNKAVSETETLINNIGTVSLDSEQLIIEAEESYDALTEKQKDNVNNYKILLEARKNFDKISNEFKYTELAEKIYNKIKESEFDFETKIEFFSDIILTSYIFNPENIRAITSSTDSTPIQIRNEAKELYNEFKNMDVENEQLKKAVDEYYISYEQLCDFLLDYNFTQTNFKILAESYQENYHLKKENLNNIIKVDQ